MSEWGIESCHVDCALHVESNLFDGSELAVLAQTASVYDTVGAFSNLLKFREPVADGFAVIFGTHFFTVRIILKLIGDDYD